MPEAQNEAQMQVAIPPLQVNLPIPTVELILRGLGKLPYDEVAAVAADLRRIAEAHIQATVAAHQAAQAAEASKAAAAAPKAKMKPTAAAAKTASKPARKR